MCLKPMAYIYWVKLNWFDTTIAEFTVDKTSRFWGQFRNQFQTLDVSTFCQSCLKWYWNRVSSLITPGFNLFSSAMPFAEFEIFCFHWHRIATLWATAPALYSSLLSLPDAMWTTINKYVEFILMRNVSLPLTTVFGGQRRHVERKYVGLLVVVYSENGVVGALVP